MTDEELAAALRESAHGPVRTLATVAARRLMELSSEVARLRGETPCVSAPAACPDPARAHSSGAWLTTYEAAAYLRMKPSGVRALVTRGSLRPDGAGAKRIHMFRLRTLDAFLVERATRREVEPTATPAGDDRPPPSPPQSIVRRVRPVAVEGRFRKLVKDWEAQHVPTQRGKLAPTDEPRPKVKKSSRAQTRAGIKKWLTEKRET